ncbi:unnamed protein product, partial [marine sediment metagenome]
RHLFYPSHMPLGGGDAQLGHTAIEVANASDSPGNGQVHIKRTLREQKKLLDAGDNPDAPTFVRDQTPLKVKGELSTQELRNEFRKAAKLSILLNDDPLIQCIRDGIDAEVFIYRKGELVWGKGDPSPSVELSANAFVHTLAKAKALGIWPRKPKETEKGEDKGKEKGKWRDRKDEKREGERDDEREREEKPAALSAEGPLNQALIVLFERARGNKIKALSELRIKLFEAKATWDVHQAVATHRGA